MLLLFVLSQILTKTTDILARLIILISQYADTHINLLFMHRVNESESGQLEYLTETNWSLFLMRLSCYYNEFLHNIFIFVKVVCGSTRL